MTTANQTPMTDAERIAHLEALLQRADEALKLIIEDASRPQVQRLKIISHMAERTRTDIERGLAKTTKVVN